jgi:hypothetical protein
VDLTRGLATVLLAALLLLKLIGFVALQGVVGQNLTALAQPFATLGAGITGLGAIAWQARVGFANLKAGQDHRAEIERDVRQH